MFNNSTIVNSKVYSYICMLILWFNISNEELKLNYFLESIFKYLMVTMKFWSYLSR